MNGRARFYFIVTLLAVGLTGCVRYADYRTSLCIEANVVNAETQQRLDDVNINLTFAKGGDVEPKEENEADSGKTASVNVSRIYDLRWGRKECAFMPLGSKEELVATFSKNGFRAYSTVLKLHTLPYRNNMRWAAMGTIALQSNSSAK